MMLDSLGLAALVMMLSSWMTSRLCSPSAVVAFLDHPNDRSLHTQPIPRTGGLAILGGLAVGLSVAQGSDWAGITLWHVAKPVRDGGWLWIAGSTVLMAAVSFWDDRTGLPAGVRLGVHGLAAIGVVYGADLAVTAVSIPLFGTFTLGMMAVPLTVLGVIWMANLYNFMDGMDGFAGGMTVMGFGLFGYLALSSGAQDLALPAMLIAAATGGFQFFNLPPARIFMGDVGSVSLGFLAGVFALMGVHAGVFDLWVPTLIFSPFIVDATVTLSRRLWRGEKVWQAHREHYYQRLVLTGWGHRKTVLAEYILMLASGATAVLYVHVTGSAQLAILVMWVITYVILAWGVRGVELKAKSQRSEA